MSNRHIRKAKRKLKNASSQPPQKRRKIMIKLQYTKLPSGPIKKKESMAVSPDINSIINNRNQWKIYQDPNPNQIVLM